MRLFILSLFTVTIVFTTAFISVRPEMTPAEILKQADLKRSPWTQMSMTAELLSSGKSGDTKSIYKVYFKDEISTLVAFVEPKFEKGNLLLMVQEDLWYYVRETRKPTRITPVQRLSGSVSYGDIARLGWSKDYNIVSSKEATLENQPVYLMELSAKSQGATYQKISLWIDKANFRPLKAEVYLLSGKLYKTLKFTKYQTMAGKDVNTQIEFVDHFTSGQKSTLDFTRIAQEKALPNRYFIKTSLADVSDEVTKW